MRLLQAVEVDDARIQALTPEAFRLVFEARGWKFDGAFVLGPSMLKRGRFVPLNSLPDENAAALALLANDHHGGATFDAFIEVDRVQALISAVDAAERGEWSPVGLTFEAIGLPPWSGGYRCAVCSAGMVHIGSLRWDLWDLWDEDSDDRQRAAAEARKQLPDIVAELVQLADGCRR